MMHDNGLISTDTIRAMRDGKREVDWAKRMKDAGGEIGSSEKEQCNKKEMERGRKEGR
jgi:hypothetical protein